MIPALNTAETEVVNSMLRGKRKIDAAIPDTMDPKEVIGAVRSICGMMAKGERVQGRLLAALGRLMLITSQRADIWIQAGYESYKDFVKVELTSKLGRSRSTLYDCRKIIKCFPALEMDTYGKIPTNSLLLLCKFTNAANRDADKLLEKAGSTPHEEFKLWLVDKGYLGTDDVAGGKTLKITGPAPKVQRLMNKLADEEIHAHVGSKDPLEILTAAMISLEQEIKPK